MTTEFTPTSAQRRSPLPGKPVPYFLDAGEGEHAHLFDALFTVLLSTDETDGQYGVFTMTAPKGDVIAAHLHPTVHEIFFVLDGQIRLWVQDLDGRRHEKLLEPGGFGYVPARVPHTFRVEADTRVLGVCTGGFERFFAAAGTSADDPRLPHPPFVPPSEQLVQAGQEFGTEFLPDLRLHEG